MMRREAWREYSRGSLWLLPVVAGALSVALGAVLRCPGLLGLEIH